MPYYGRYPHRPFRLLSLLTVSALSLTLITACDDDDEEPVPAPPSVLETFDDDGVLEANIRWTTYGVPHITAENLESLSYGVGYAFARDNLCILADQIVRYNSQRSRYYGPDRVPGSGDSSHLISDFGFLTIGIREIAEESLSTMSDTSQAMYQGYTAGYNRYLEDTPVEEQDPACAGQPWVTSIDATDLLTYSLGVAVLPGATNFLSAMFVAAPPGKDFTPVPESANLTLNINHTSAIPDTNPAELGSNGWGLGADKTENGMGMVLANPHFPHTGSLRFWQFHTTVPGFLNVTGASLIGLPGAVNIGFNDNVAWTHTFSSAEHFVVYQLSLDETDTDAQTQLIDGETVAIEEKDMVIEVAVGGGQTVNVRKTAYYTNYGPMIEIPGSFDWTATQAFAIKDANLPNLDILDHWMAMNLATSMDEFKQAFMDYDGVIFNNTMAASSDGQVFYIDDSTVPNLSATAIGALTTVPQLVQTRAAAGFTVLSGNQSAFDFDGPVPYEAAPKYEGNDAVQNSNNSYWLTNVDSPITGISPLYGGENDQQTLRSRMGQKLLEEGSGSDGLFTSDEVETLLMSNRSYLAEEILADVLTMCTVQGATPVDVDGESVSIEAACNALALWDGTMNTDSVGGQVFREFAYQFQTNPQWEVAFDASQPLTTPSGLVSNATTLEQFARAVTVLEDAGVAPDATLGEVQFVQRARPDGTADPERLPWAGANNVEGGFNVFRPVPNTSGLLPQNATLLPQISYAPLNDVSEISAEAGGYRINYGSSWMMVVNFTDTGPAARALLTYSQSRVYGSDHFLDQTRRYSAQPALRPVAFTDDEIEAAKIEEMTLVSQ